MPAFTDDLTRLSDKTLRTLANTAAWDVAVAAENELERRETARQAYANQRQFATWRGQHNTRLHNGGC